jgi:GT2 family glycosyltransferase
MAEAQGRILALVDADCVPSRRWLRELTAPFWDDTVVIAAGAIASFPPRTPAQRFPGRYGLNDALRCVQQPLMPFANGRNMAVRRDAAMRVGGWPQDLGPGEDIEFSYRIRRMFGETIAYQSAALVFHQDRETDEELRHQAIGYGRGIAMLYAAHPEFLRWSWRERTRQLWMSLGRRSRAAALLAGAPFGHFAPDDVEFATYLARWDTWFWQGFHEHRRASGGR